MKLLSTSPVPLSGVRRATWTDAAVLRITPALYRQIAIITRRGQELSPAAARLAQLIGAMIEGDGPRP